VQHQGSSIKVKVMQFSASHQSSSPSRLNDSLQTPTPLNAAAGSSQAAEHSSSSPNDVRHHTVQIHHFPDPIAHFTGREREIKTIERLATQGARLVEISDWQGRGGIGKSALAIQSAHHLQQTAPETSASIQLYANFHGYDALPRDAKDVLQELLLLRFGINPTKLPQKLSALQQLYRQRLQGQRVLLLFDNVSSLPQIEPLLPPAKDSLTLITSRKPLLSQEQGKTLYLEGLSSASATQLLQTMVGDDRIPNDGSPLRQLLQLSGCLPLTLRILGTYLRQHPAITAEMLVLKLQQERIKYKNFSPQNVDLFACLSFVYNSLSPNEQSCLKRLSVLRGDDFDLAMAAHLNGLKEDAPVRTLLKSLLLQQWISKGVGRDRFILHDIVRLFIWDKIKPQDRQMLILRALAWQDQQVSAIDKFLLFKQRSDKPDSDVGCVSA
jgi:hypothetical protein